VLIVCFFLVKSPRVFPERYGDLLCYLHSPREHYRQQLVSIGRRWHNALHLALLKHCIIFLQVRAR
jgi:hypothetical protein